VEIIVKVDGLLVDMLNSANMKCGYGFIKFDPGKTRDLVKAEC